MAEEKESPTLAQPKKEEKKEASVDIDGLIKTLEMHGVQAPDQLEGKLRASREVGQMAQLLGEQRKIAEQLQSELNELRNRPQPRPHNLDNIDNYDSGQTINLEDVISKSVEKALTKRERAMLENQERTVKAYNRIIGDKNYNNVKSVWEEKLKDPQFVFQLQNGLLDPMDAYRGVVDDYKDSLLRQSLDTIKKLKTGGAPPPPPHMETGERASQNLVSEGKPDSPAKKRITELREKARKGQLLSETEETELAMLAFAPLV